MPNMLSVALFPLRLRRSRRSWNNLITLTHSNKWPNATLEIHRFSDKSLFPSTDKCYRASSTLNWTILILTTKTLETESANISSAWDQFKSVLILTVQATHSSEKALLSSSRREMVIQLFLILTTSCSLTVQVRVFKSCSTFSFRTHAMASWSQFHNTHYTLLPAPLSALRKSTTTSMKNKVGA